MSIRHPQYEVRTNRERLEWALRDQATVIASGVALAVLAIGAGFALTLTLFVHLPVHHRDTVAALHTLGVSRRLIVSIITLHGALLDAAEVR